MFLWVTCEILKLGMHDIIGLISEHISKKKKKANVGFWQISKFLQLFWPWISALIDCKIWPHVLEGAKYKKVCLRGARPCQALKPIPKETEGQCKVFKS